MTSAPSGLQPAHRTAVAVAAIVMAVVTATLVAAWAAGRPLGGQAAVHLSLTLALLAVALRADRVHPATGALVTSVAVIGSMFFLYTSLAHVAFAAIPWNGDPWVRAADRALGLGADPVAWVSDRLPTWSIEPLAFCYAAFIPYLYLTIFLGLIGRPPATRAVFVLAFALTYGVSFMGYLFVPARGPIVAMADALGRPLAGGTFHALVTRSVEVAGGPHGAFPSLHIGATCLGALVDYRHGDRLRSLIYLPLLLVIAVATVGLRYHYAIDLLAGAAIAWGAVVTAERWVGSAGRAAALRTHAAGRSGGTDPAPTHAAARSGGTGPAPTHAYRLMRALLRLSLHGFFRRVAVQGAERIPTEGPVLIVGNHTNAFVDLLVVLTGIRRPVTLTAKSTLVRNPLLTPVIRALDVVLLHRRSDREEGADPSLNVDALTACVCTLAAGGAVLVFPEGVSHSDPSLRPFKTGAARIVADFLEERPGRDLTIVPVGLHYSKKDRWRSEVVALVGASVSARAWAEAAGEADEPTDVAIDVRALTDAMRGWVESLTLNFVDEEERTLAIAAEELLAHRPAGPEPLGEEAAKDAAARVETMHRLRAGAHELRSVAPGRFEALARGAHTLYGRLRRLGVSAEEVSLPMRPPRAALFVVRELEVALVGGPLALAGWLLNWPALVLTRSLVRKMSVDEDHRASNAVFVSMPIFLLWASTNRWRIPSI